MSWRDEMPEMGKRAKEAARILAVAPTAPKNSALREMARTLRMESGPILSANAQDVTDGRAGGLSGAMIDRLVLTEARIDSMAGGLEDIAALRDPIGEVDSAWTNAAGIEIARTRVPLGVIGIIYEARPNVTSDAAGLCLKSGNAVILRGGSEAHRSNTAIVNALCGALEKSGLPKHSVQTLPVLDREASIALMRMRDIDVLIPRGGRALKETVARNASVPYIMTGMGNWHIFIDESADHEKARRITVNAKCQRPGVCNAVETLLVHRNVSDVFLASLTYELIRRGVEIRGDARVRSLRENISPATEEDWKTEYEDLILAVKSVSGLDEAIEHIHRYGTRHSDCIVTENYTNARRFQAEVDSAAVYANASTRFTDGGEFGFGAEIGISTQKLHARGPMGLEQLTSVKYIISGDGQIRED